MRKRLNFCKADFFVSLLCLGFLAVCLGAIGGGGRKNAKEELCLANLKQMGMAYSMYTNDNGGYFSEYITSRNAWTKTNQRCGVWYAVLKPYFKDYKAINCPFAAIPLTSADGTYIGGKQPYVGWGILNGDYFYEVKGAYGSYGENGWIENYPAGSFDTQCWRTPNQANAGIIPVLADSWWFMAWPRSTDAPPDYNGQVYGSNGNDMPFFCLDREGVGTTSSLFMDWSARKVGLKELWRLKWHKTYDTSALLPIWPLWMSNFKNYN